MSTTETTRPTSDDCPTEVLQVLPTAAAPSRCAGPSCAPAPAPAPFADWRDAAPTEELPATPAVPATPSATVPARPRVSTHHKPTRGREAAQAPSRRSRTRTKVRHLRAALAGLLIAAAVLIPMQLFAAQGISSARRAALEQARTPAASAVPLSGQSTSTPASPMSGQSPAQPDWVTEHTGSAYDRTNPAASPLDLPRCTTSPDTPLPCLATISPSQTRAVVLEEDASLTALVRR